MDADVLLFFDGHMDALPLYEALKNRIGKEIPDVRVKVQKSQVSFYGRRLFAMASLPRRKKDPGLVVSFGLGRREPSPRITVAVEPYPGRWTHHVPVPEERELDGELLGWLWEAWEFNKTK